MRCATAVFIAVLSVALHATGDVAAAAGGQVGSTDVHSGATTSTAGRALAFPFSASAGGAVNRLNVYLDGTNTARGVEVGLYTGSSGGPGRRRASCVIASLTPNSWNRCTFTAYTIIRGTRYWLAFLQPAGSRGTLGYRGAYVRDARPSASSTRSMSLTLLPRSWTDGRGLGRYRSSVYADLTETPAAQCADGQDNDADGLVDLNDPGCTSASDNDEITVSPPPAVDSDGDGVPDGQDQCPNASGPASNNGCPASGGLPPGVSLRAPDGGRDYFAQFSNHGAMGDPSYFPLWLWGQYNMTNANIAKDKSLGFNGYYSLANPEPDANLDGIGAAGMYAVLGTGFAASSASKPAVIGWQLGDEADMCTGCPANGYPTVENANSRLPRDGRFRFMNYGKGVLFWWTNLAAGRFVNGAGTNLTMGSPGGYQDVVSADAYWFTDTDNEDAYQGQCFYNGCGVGGNITADQRQRGYNYGLNIARLRELDALDGRRQPIFGQIEMARWETDRGDGIVPAEMHAALWHSIIAGARGVVYFPFSWGTSCPTDHVQRDTSGCWTATQNQAKADNALVQQLAPILNGDFADGYATPSAGIHAMTKRGPDGHFYVFAGNKDNAAKTATFRLAVQSGTAVKIGETAGQQQIAVQNGQFSDQFAEGNTIHIYRID